MRANFLGAGASKTFGYPLTSELLLKTIENLNDKEFLGTLTGDKSNQGSRNRRLLRSYLKQLLPGKSLKRNNLPLITSLLSLLDFSLSTGQSVLPTRSIEQTREARRLLERAILETIGDDEPFDGPGSQQFDAFCHFLSDLNGDKQPAAIVTTNYDMAGDLAACAVSAVTKDSNGEWNIEEIATKIDFGFAWYRPDTSSAVKYLRPTAPLMTLYKLHGSTNWLRCPLCDNIYINPWAPIWHQAYRSMSDDFNECDCSPTKLEAQIISPSFVRTMRDPNLLGVWKNTLDLLREAEHWIIIGYSFPDEDLGVRALFTRAYGARNSVPRISVVMMDKDALPRYEAFFGELNYVSCGLSAFLDQWSSH